MTEPLRKPAIFSVNDPRLVPAPLEEPPVGNAVATLPEVVLPPASAPSKRRMRWGALFWSALSALVTLGLGVAVTSFVEELFARSPWLGGVGLALALITGLALTVIVLREAFGLMRLGKVESLRERAESIIDSDDRERGRALVADLLTLTARMPTLARARARLSEHRSDIIDGRDLVRLAERELMSGPDAEARRLVAAASKRVSVVTAISPRAAIDMLFVLANAFNLIRRLAVLYGARPGTLGVLKLLRQVVSHLAVTGGVAISDSVLQQLVGHGIAARLSARLGEGMVNGLLTARLGLLAIDLVRPLPFHELPRPALGDVAANLLRSAGEGDGAREAPAVPPRTP